MNTPSKGRSLFRPFTRETAIEKIRKAEQVWNSRDLQQASLADTLDSLWRNRSGFRQGRAGIVPYPQRDGGPMRLTTD